MNARLLAAYALLAIACPAWALDPAYLSEWPAVDRVLADHQGETPQDTMARQMAALHILQNSIEEMAGPRRWHGLTPDEIRLKGQYHAGAERIRAVVNATLSNEFGPGVHGPFAKPPLREWYALQWEYESDPAFRAVTLQRYLSPLQLAALGAPAQPAGSDAGPSEMRRIGPRMLFAACAALVVLVIVVRGARRLSARRRAKHAAAANQLAQEGEGSNAKGQRHGTIISAAVEVLDSLEPYMIAARRQGRRIPIGVFGDPEIVGFLSVYARSALAAVAGTDETDVDENDAADVLKQLLMTQHERLARIFDGRLNAPPGAMDEDSQVASTKGGIRATIALSMFRVEGADALDLDKFGGVDRDADEPILQGKPPGTRLHPRGSGAEMGQLLVLRSFSKRLAQLAKEMV